MDDCEAFWKLSIRAGTPLDQRRLGRIREIRAAAVIGSGKRGVTGRPPGASEGLAATAEFDPSQTSAACQSCGAKCIMEPKADLKRS